ncbi:MAG: hypothetical protein O9320_15555 [Magnetospirillum sp.]|jgi:hypothetical protein|nr:hypothetical protein [Magnetospirillum sp.]
MRFTAQEAKAMSMNAALSPRTILRLDGVVCFAMGSALIGFSSMLAEPTGLSLGFLLVAGLLLLPSGLVILAVSWPLHPPRLGVAVVVLGNLLWVVASFGVLFLGIVQPTRLGVGLIVGQAVAVLAIAALEARPLSARLSHS